MNIVSIAIFCIGLWSYAENSSLRTLFNQIAHGQLSCLNATASDLSNMQALGGSSCKKIESHLTSFNENSYQLFEKTLFSLAAKIQINRDFCLQSQVKDFFKDDSSSLTYMAPLTVNWIRWRQASLKLEKCNTMFFSRIDKNITNSKGVPFNPQTTKEKWAFIKSKDKIYRDRGYFLYQRLSPENLKKREDFCFDPKQITKLQEIKSLSEFSIPIFSSLEMFDIISKFSGVIKYKENGKNVSDEDLEKLETLDFKDIYIDKEVFRSSSENCSKANHSACLENNELKSLTRQIREFLSSTAKNRIQISKEIIDKASTGKALDENERDYLFEAESIHEALAEVNELPGYLDGIPLNEIRVSNSVACLFDKYQKQPASIKGLSVSSSNKINTAFSFLEFPITALLQGMILRKGVYESSFKALKSAGVINQPSVRFGLKKLKPVTSYSSGFAYEGARYLYKEFDKQCISAAGTQNRAQPVNLVANNLWENLKGLSEEEFKSIYKKFSLTTASSGCQNLKDTDLIQNNFYRTNCIEALIENLAPGKVAIPALIFFESTRDN